jgi:hypothetical protein
MKTRQNTPPLVAGMNGERGSRGCNPLERGFQRGCRPLWSRAGLMPRLRSVPARSVEDAKGGGLLCMSMHSKLPHSCLLASGNSPLIFLDTQPHFSLYFPYQKASSYHLSLSVYPAAIHLRFLQTLTKVATEKNSTTIVPFPIDLLTAFLQKKEKE